MYDSCAADGYVSSIYTIAIGSAASDGTQASYDEDCSGKMAVVFVNNPHGQVSVVSAWLYFVSMAVHLRLRFPHVSKTIQT